MQTIHREARKISGIRLMPCAMNMKENKGGLQGSHSSEEGAKREETPSERIKSYVEDSRKACLYVWIAEAHFRAM